MEKENYLIQLKKKFNVSFSNGDFVDLIEEFFSYITSLSARIAFLTLKLEDYQKRNKVLQKRIEDLEKIAFKK